MAESPAWTSTLELATKAAAVAASISLAASLVFDWGFYSALNLSFLEVPSVFSDHVRSGLLWFPKVVTSFGVILIYEMLSQRIEKGMTEEELIQSSPNPKWTRRFRASPHKLFAYLSVLIVIGYIIAGDYFLGGLPAGLCVVWVTFSVWAQSPSRIVEHRPIAIRLAIHLLPPIAIWLYFSGYSEAVRLYQPSTPVSHLTISGESAPESVVLLRQLDKGLLIKEANNSVGFRPWSEVKKIETPGKYIPTKGVICSQFGVGCISLETQSSAQGNEKSNPAVHTDLARKAAQGR